MPNWIAWVVIFSCLFLMWFLWKTTKMVHIFKCEKCAFRHETNDIFNMMSIVWKHTRAHQRRA